MKLIMNVPSYVKTIQDRLLKNEYECYLVGGCIRDTLLGLLVNDYDLTTNCDIRTLLNLFSDYNIINKNGEKHNTITIHIDNYNVEITSYKHAEGEDNSIEVDLMHRDLTINALAYDAKLIDVVGGYDDLINKIIRMPGKASQRIEEDPLRILRALRFYSKLNFKMENNTSDAIHKYKDLLNSVSSERIKNELDEILSGDNVFNVLNEYYDVISTIIPELKDTYNFDQKNEYHKNTLYKHIINVCSNVDIKSNRLVLVRTAALLHDIAKPKCFSQDQNGNGHFYGHAEESAKMAFDILRRLKYSNSEIEKIIYLIKFHDSTINMTKKSIKKNLSHTPNQDEELFYMLIELMNADKLDHTMYELIDLSLVKSIVEEIKAENTCLKLRDLKVNGYDMMELGFEKKNIGIVLNYLLEAVIDERIANDRVELINGAKVFKNVCNIDELACNK